MATELDDSFKPRCFFIQRDETIWVVASYWSEFSDGYVYGEIVASFLSSDVAAKTLGNRARAALKKFTVHATEKSEPPDPWDILSKGKLNKFTKGCVGATLVWARGEKSLKLTGSFAPTGAGLVNYKMRKPVSDTVTETELGELILKRVQADQETRGSLILRRDQCVDGPTQLQHGGLALLRAEAVKEVG